MRQGRRASHRMNGFESGWLKLMYLEGGKGECAGLDCFG